MNRLDRTFVATGNLSMVVLWQLRLAQGARRYNRRHNRYLSNSLSRGTSSRVTVCGAFEAQFGVIVIVTVVPRATIKLTVIKYA